MKHIQLMMKPRLPTAISGALIVFMKMSVKIGKPRPMAL